MSVWPSRLWEYIARSTLKREAASVLMVWYLAVGTVLFSQMSIEQAITTWNGLQIAVFGIFTAAFLGDFVAKQTNWGGPPQTPDASGLTVKVEPQDVKIDGVVKGTINVEDTAEPKING